MTRLLLGFALFCFLPGCGDDGDSAGSPGTGGLAGAGSGGMAGVGAGGSGGQVCVAPGSESVSVQNDYGTLGGVLEVPAACPDTVVLFLSGSGSQDRDGNAYGSATDMYKTVATALRDSAGVATLRFDDHGIKDSVSAAPALKDFTFDLEVRDAARWVEWLRTDGRFSKVVIAGHSQGSLTGILADRQAPIDGFISLAGAGRPVGKLIIEQVQAKLSGAQLDELKQAVADLEAGKLPGPLTPPLDQIIPTDTQPYLVTWMKWDPAAEVANLKAPTIIAQGTTDRQVKVSDAEALATAKPDAQLLIVNDMCHTLKQATWDTAQQKAAYTDPSVPLAAGLVDGLATFLTTLP
ncbi:MAG: alpha/beta fold hydrolase [Polyangiaceae bacterium]